MTNQSCVKVRVCRFIRKINFTDQNFSLTLISHRLTFRSIRKIAFVIRFSLGMALISTPVIPLEPVNTNYFIATDIAIGGENAYTHWKNSADIFIPPPKQRNLFENLGINTAICIQNKQEKWFLTSSESTYYFDAKIEEVLHQWQKPGMNELIPKIYRCDK